MGSLFIKDLFFEDTISQASEAKEAGAFLLVDDDRAVKIYRVQQISFIKGLLVPKLFWYSFWHGPERIS